MRVVRGSRTRPDVGQWRRRSVTMGCGDGRLCTVATQRMTAMSTFSDAVIDHEGLRRLHDYWASKKGDRKAPSRADIRPEEMVPLLPSVYLVDVEGTRFRLRLVGTEIVLEYGAEITG